MAFYFALMNISNTSLDNSTKRRSSSLSHNHHQVQRFNRRHCTITSYDADVLFKQDEVSSQIYQNLHEFHEIQKDSKLKNDIQEKKVTFEKEEPGKTAIKVENLLRNHAFLDKGQKTNANYKVKNIAGHMEQSVTIFQNANVENKERNVAKKLLSIWKTPSYGDVAGAWLLNTKRSNFKHEAEVNEGYPLGLSTYSARVQRANDRVIAPNIVQNAANELIEHKLILSAPLRRNFWKSAALPRRRSASDSYLKYTWSYFNPEFRFVEDEFKALKSDCRTAS